MRLASLGSGSRGNATLIESGAMCLLIDCGLSVSRVQSGLRRLGRTLDDLTAIVVTHEHSDHIGGVERLARRLGLTVWMTAGTASAFGARQGVDVTLFSSHQPFTHNGVSIHPFPVPHDAREPTQLVIDDGRCRFGVLTDLGSVTPHVVEMLTACDALLLECNHDPDLLMRGEYPAALKRRVGAIGGHLSNQQAADLLARLDHARLRCVVAAHLSEKNNHPDLAIAALHEVLGDIDRLQVADQEAGLDWVVVD
ncbi:MAG: MBL fold metallo-hydrolase [Pseudomonadota bacterium]|nr:MAG: MBL fold metallo-hydrolase [Pseudomonadota bacterium]